MIVAPTLGDRLDARRGIGPGFDHLRIGLSLAILVWHSFGISYGIEWTRSNATVATLRPLINCLLPMFFALSGFLVMGSAQRIGNLKTFISFRVFRILPALFTEITLSALIVGPLLTAYPLATYFGDPRFIEYFGSLIGRVRFVLPGLFLDTPTPEVVNGALWTVGPEIFCYIVMTLLILTGIVRHPRALLIFTGIFLLSCLISDLGVKPYFWEVLPTKSLILSFLTGNLLYMYHHRLPFSVKLMVAALAAALALLAVAQLGRWSAFAMFPAVVGISYVTVFIGLCDLPRLPFFGRGDYSYGIYIFGFPVQQTVTQFLPAYRVWWVNLAIALPITLLFAVASWHWIEKPVLGLRKRFVAGGQADPPLPFRNWTAREWRLGAFTAAYGLFVAAASGIFPIQTVYDHAVGRQSDMDVQSPPAGL